MLCLLKCMLVCLKYFVLHSVLNSWRFIQLLIITCISHIVFCFICISQIVVLCHLHLADCVVFHTDPQRSLCRGKGLHVCTFPPAPPPPTPPHHFSACCLVLANTHVFSILSIRKHPYFSMLSDSKDPCFQYAVCFSRHSSFQRAVWF